MYIRVLNCVWFILYVPYIYMYKYIWNIKNNMYEQPAK